MKKVLAFVLSLMMMLTLVACGNTPASNNNTNGDDASGGSNSPEDASTNDSTVDDGDAFTYDFKVTTPLGESHTSVKYWTELFEELSERTDGRLTGKVYPNSTLAGGNMTTATDMVQKGTIDILVCGAGMLDGYVPEMDLPAMAFLFDNNEAADGTLNDDYVLGYYRDKLSPNGFYLLGWMENAWAEITNSKRELTTDNFLNGLTMRVAGNQVLSAAYESAGATTVNIDLSELYTALQQGVCDGEENGLAGAITANNLYEVQKYILYCQYSYGAFSCCINQKLWESIPESDQQIIMDVFNEYAPQQIEANRNAMETSLQTCIDYGCEIHYITDEERAAWKEIMGPSCEKVQNVLAENYDLEFANEFIKLAEEYK